MESKTDLPQSKYLNLFTEAAKTFTLVGNKMLVERLDDEEVKTAGGLIIGESKKVSSELKSHRPLVAIVVAVGEGYTDPNDDTKKLPLDVKPGSVVVLNPMGVEFFSTIPGFSLAVAMKLGIAAETDVRMRFDTLEAFSAYKKMMETVAGG